MIIFKIDDKGKKFQFQTKWYKTPCNVILQSPNQIASLTQILTENGIACFNIMNKIKSIVHTDGKSKRILQPGTVAMSISIV